MGYGLLVAAIIAALVSGGVCFALKIRKTYVVLLIQFVSSFALTSILAFNMALAQDYTQYGKLALICAGICLLIFGIETFLKKTIGPLENRKPG